MLLVAACGGSGSDTAQMRAMRDEMCACKDKSCTEAVEKKHAAWSQSLRTKYAHGEHGLQIPDDLAAIAQQSDACMHKAREAADREELEHTVLHPPPSPPSAAADKLIAIFRPIKDKMCACTDKACSDKVDAELDAQQQALSKASPDLDPSDDQQHTLEELGAAIEACRKR